MKTVFLIALLLFSVYPLDNEIRNVEDLITLVNSKEFEDYAEQHEDDDVKLQSIFGGDECLVSSSDAKNLLKTGYGITNNSPDKRIRFILGRCSPVLLIPGIYATKYPRLVNPKKTILMYLPIISGIWSFIHLSSCSS